MVDFLLVVSLALPRTSSPDPIPAHVHTLAVLEEALENTDSLFVISHGQHGGLDEKSLAEQALVSAKEAKELLFRLVADGVVTVQEVPRRADRHPQFTFYVFQADFDHLHRYT